MNRAVARLTVLAIACGLLISFADAVTRDTIEANRSAWAADQLLAVTGDASYRIEPLAPGLYALDGEAGRGFVFEVVTDEGYNGRIALWLAVDVDGEILGVRVKEHQETPGLGDKIELAVSDWILSFDGYSLDAPGAAWDVRRHGGEFDQFTGATITPRAVVHAVRDGLIRYRENREAWSELQDAGG